MNKMDEMKDLPEQKDIPLPEVERLVKFHHGIQVVMMVALERVFEETGALVHLC